MDGVMGSHPKAASLTHFLNLKELGLESLPLAAHIQSEPEVEVDFVDM